MSRYDSELTEMAVAAMEAAVRKVVEDHRRRGRPLAVWEGGRVVMKMPSPVASEQETGNREQGEGEGNAGQPDSGGGS